jgi:hypothetical protein
MGGMEGLFIDPFFLFFAVTLSQAGARPVALIPVYPRNFMNNLLLIDVQSVSKISIE